MSETGRWALPLLDAGQAQKEMTHNEALATLDLLTQGCVVAVDVDTPPTNPASGQCWVTGASPTGSWAGRARMLAGWTAGGWRFVAPRDGFAVWSEADGCSAVFSGGQWRVGRVAATELVIAGKRVVGQQQPAIPAPNGGTVADTEARAVLAQVVAALVSHGLVAP